jgi:ribosomal RNA assembly protein
MKYLKIPEERIPVLIGERGSVKKDIEARTKTALSIEDTSVSIDSRDEGNGLNEMVAENIVLAIGRGFNPGIAFALTKEDYTLEIIHLREYGGTPNALERMKSRVIGEGGKARKTLEELTGTNISVYGKTISIIGSFDDVPVARDAVLRIIEGDRHSSVYRFLEKTKVQRQSEQWARNLPSE